jgi:hypothetical protein
MSVSQIPTFGSINGTSGTPSVSGALGIVSTPVAILYNYYDPSLMSENSHSLRTNSANRILLNAYTDASNTAVDPSTNATVFPMKNFLNLFYATNAGYFNVNPTNSNNPCVILSSQTYTSSNSDFNKFSLVQALLKAYCDNNGVNVNDLDPRIVLLLQKETFPTQSLAAIKGTCLSLSWDEVINSLIRSGVIDGSGNPTNPSYAAVPLNVVLNYHSFVLNIDLSITFTYYVDVRGYAIPPIPPAQPSYSSNPSYSSY